MKKEIIDVQWLDNDKENINKLLKYIKFAAPTMYLSKQQGHSVSVKSVNTIASGLAPPYAGKEDCERNF